MSVLLTQGVSFANLQTVALGSLTVLVSSALAHHPRQCDQLLKVTSETYVLTVSLPLYARLAVASPKDWFLCGHQAVVG